MVMLEIIPNWHPVFVHFSVALLSIATLLFVIGSYAPAGWRKTSLKAAHVNLWLGVIITIGTVTAGLLAAGSVAHDAESHAYMMEHRNWAISTAAVFLMLALWSALRFRHSWQRGGVFLVLMALATAALAVTGYKGGELVYRHGTGVLSLPDAGDGSHSTHEHGSAVTAASSSEENEHDAHNHVH